MFIKEDHTGKVFGLLEDFDHAPNAVALDPQIGKRVSVARSALSWEARPSASTSSRVMPRFLAMRSADVNWSGELSQGQSGGWK